MTRPHDQPPGTDACCATDERIGRHFDRRLAELMEGDQLPEMVDVSAMLLRQLEADVAAVRPTVLELGCGSGALGVALLSCGAARLRGVDLSPDMVAAAERRAAAAGVAERASFAVADGALLAHATADWVILDRVICCYPDPDRLLATAQRAAGSRVAFSVPIWHGWRGWINRIGWALENIPARLFGKSCPTFVHDIGRLERQLSAAGFRRVAIDRLGLWYAAVWDCS